MKISTKSIVYGRLSGYSSVKDKIRLNIPIFDTSWDTYIRVCSIKDLLQLKFGSGTQPQYSLFKIILEVE